MAQLRVLVVEDEWLIAMDLTTCLEDLGHRVVGPFLTVAEAEAAARSQPIDIAFLDINLGKEVVFPLAGVLMDTRRPVRPRECYLC